MIEQKQGNYYQPQILDACCGSRMFHFNKNNPGVRHETNNRQKWRRMERELEQ